MNTQDLRYLIASGILTASIFLTSFGIPWAIFPAIAYITFNGVMIIIASGVFMNPDVFPEDVAKYSAIARHRNHSIQFIVNLTTGVFIYQAFTLGYVFTAGFFTFMLMMSVVSNILTFLRMIKERE